MNAVALFAGYLAGLIVHSAPVRGFRLWKARLQLRLLGWELEEVQAELAVADALGNASEAAALTEFRDALAAEKVQLEQRVARLTANT